MNENQSTQTVNDDGHEQSETKAGASVNGSESELSLILKDLKGIKTSLSSLETGQAKLETDISNLQTGQKVLDVKVSAFSTQIDGYNDKISGQDAKIEGQDAKVSAAIIKVDAQDTKFESQNDKLISQDTKIASQDTKIVNAGFNTMHKTIAIIVATVIFFIQVWNLLPDGVKEIFSLSSGDKANSLLLFIGCTSLKHNINPIASPLGSIYRLGVYVQKFWRRTRFLNGSTDVKLVEGCVSY